MNPEMADRRLREAWTNKVQAEDYEAHMAAVGQAQANAALVAELIAQRGPAPGANVLIVGAGTGQMFEFAPAAMLAPYHTTFSDITSGFLKKLTARLGAAPELKFETVVDDIEDSRLEPGFDLVIAVLVLEHVDFKKAIIEMCRLSNDRVFVVIQENPADMTSAMTKSRPAIGSMQVFKELNPDLVPQSKVEIEFKNRGFSLRRASSREVLDSKRMIALEFERGS